MSLRLLILNVITVTVNTEIPLNGRNQVNITSDLSNAVDISKETVTPIHNGSTILNSTEPYTTINSVGGSTINHLLTNIADTTVTSRSGSSTSSPKGTSLSDPSPGDVCPNMPKVEGINTIVKCKCKENEILSDNGQCLPYTGKMYINIDQKGVTKLTSNSKVVTKDIQCDVETHRLLNFTKGQFYFRMSKGDVVLLPEAGELDGQRIHRYCIIHRLDVEGNLTWTLKGCVPHPSVPRCCPFGQVMKDGSCQSEKTPILLTPPISAKTSGDSVEWPNITNFLSPLKCDADPIKIYPLSNRTFHLLSLANGVAQYWRLPETITKDEYEMCPNFCVDGVVNDQGNVDYFTSLCYSDARDRHRQACADWPCVRKCCRNNEVADLTDKLPQCNRFPKGASNPPVATNLSRFNITYGWPLCSPIKWEMMISEGLRIDEKGSLLYNGIQYLPSDYCTGNFSRDGSIIEEGFVYCNAETTWEKIRNVAFPVSYAISFVFLVITISCHLLVPRMLQYGGLHQLCHAICLAIGYLVNFINRVLGYRLYPGNGLCFCLGILMQFGFLGAFFWLNVMCFELWRTTRSLKSFMRDYKRIPTWCFMVYAWGAPVCICVVTVMLDLLAPDNVPGLIKPGIGDTRCWFKGDWELLAYFYGPIATLFVFNIVFLVLTLFGHRKLMQKYKANIEYLQMEGKHGNAKTGTDGGNMPPKHITDHVPEFTQKMRIFMLCAACWLTEVLSFKIPPLELWALTDILNTLQGLALFLILIGNRNKRKLLQRKFPKVFKYARRFLSFLSSLRDQLSNRGRDQPSEKHAGQESSAVSEFAMTVSSVSMSTISLQDATLSTSLDTLGNSAKNEGHLPDVSKKKQGVF